MEILNLYQDLIMQMVGMAVLLIINYWKYRVDFKKDLKKNEQVHQKLFELIDKIEKKINKLSEDSDFSQNLFNVLTKKSMDIINVNIDLDSKIIRVLNFTVSKIREFALKHHKSHFRRTKKDIEEYLFVESDSIFTDIDNLADMIFVHKSKDIVYSKFVKENTDMEIVVRMMIKQLIENGLDEQQYIDLFEDFIEDLFKEIIKGWRLWHKSL